MTSPAPSSIPSSPQPSTRPAPISSPSLSSDSDSDLDGPAAGEDVDELELGGGGGGGGSDEEGLGGVSGKKRNFDESTDLTPAACLWGECGALFWELDPLIEHLHNVHAFPPDAPAPPTKKGALTYICNWSGCPRKGKNQNSKFALVSHLRSHTGEKPFSCPRPECDKSFTRTDALQKHMRVQHAEVIAPGRRPQPGVGPSKRRKGRAASVDSEDEEGSVLGGPGGTGAGGAGAAGAEDDEEPLWTEEELALFEANPEQNRFWIGYVVEKAKGRYLLGEHEGLVNELEALGRREAELGAECEELMRRCLRKECSDDPSDPHNAQAVELFLTAYDHVPEKAPTVGKLTV